MDTGLYTRSNSGSNNNNQIHIRKNRRCRPGTIALRKVRREQSYTDRLINRELFIRLVRDITLRTSSQRLKFTCSAIKMLEWATEEKIITVMRATNLMTTSSRRVTTTRKDMQNAQKLYEIKSGLCRITENLDPVKHMRHAFPIITSSQYNEPMANDLRNVEYVQSEEDSCDGENIISSSDSTYTCGDESDDNSEDNNNNDQNFLIPIHPYPRKKQK